MIFGHFRAICLKRSRNIATETSDVTIEPTDSFQSDGVFMNDLIKQLASDLNWNKWVAANSSATVSRTSAGIHAAAKEGCISPDDYPTPSLSRAS
jgi:hypothetical protein